MTHVFISYADVDRPTMENIARSLMREALTIWTNKTDIKAGTQFKKEIEKGIEGADSIVYLISEKALESQYCQQEIQYALSLNKRIIPVLVKPTDLDKIASEILSVQFIDLSQAENEPEYHQGIDRLVAQLQEDTVYFDRHKVLLVKALKWRQQNENTSLLLRGYSLKQAKTWLELAQKRERDRPLPIHIDYISVSANQPPTISLDVFIGYTPEDGDFTRCLNDALQIQGKTTWFDLENLEEDIDAAPQLRSGIEQCDNFLFVISPQSVQSENCLTALDYAAELGKRIVAIVYRVGLVVEPPPVLAEVPTVDFKQHDGDFNANLGDLIRTLDTDREHLQQHTKWLQRAIEWDKQQKTPDLLLRGSEFVLAESWLQEAREQDKQPPPTPLQIELIEKSKKAIVARQRRDKQIEIAIRSLLVLSVVGAIVTTGFWQQARQEEERAKIAKLRALNASSEANLALDRQLDALIDAMSASRAVRSLSPHPSNEQELTALKRDIDESLSKILYPINERNRFAGHKAEVRAIAFSPDGKTIVTGGEDNFAILRDANGRLLDQFEAHNNSILDVGFHPSEPIFATASVDSTVKLWRIKPEGEGEQKHTFLVALVGHSNWVNDVDFAENGRLIATASDDGTAKLWRYGGEREVEELATLPLERGDDEQLQLAANEVAFHADGRFLTVADDRGYVEIWDIETPENPQRRNRQKIHEAAIESLTFSRLGEEQSVMLTGSVDGTIKLSNAGNLPDLNEQDFPRLGPVQEASINDIALDRDGQFIAAADSNNTIYLWNAQGLSIERFTGHTEAVTDITFSPDGQTLASAGADNTTRLWSLRGSGLVKMLYGHEATVGDVVFVPNSQTLVSVDSVGAIVLWSTADRTQLNRIGGGDEQSHTDAINAAAVSNDGKTLVTASEDRTVKIWDVRSAAEITLVRTIAGDSDADSTAVSGDGQTIAYGSRDGTVTLWNRQGQQLAVLSGHTDFVADIAFAPDGQTLATVSADDTLKLWDLSGTLLDSIVAHDGPVYAVAFSPDGQTIATGSGDRTVKLWTIDKEELRPSQEEPLIGHDRTVRDVAFSPDGKYLVTTGADRLVKVWSQLQQGDEFAFAFNLSGSADTLFAVGFSPDGETVAAGGADRSIKLWDWNQVIQMKEEDKLLNLACDWAENYLRNALPEEESNIDPSQLCPGI